MSEMERAQEMLDDFKRYRASEDRQAMVDIYDYIIGDLEEKLSATPVSGARQEKILVCMPNTGEIKNKIVGSMIAMDKTENTKWYLIGGSLIYDAREKCAKTAIEEGFDYLMFIDSDIEFPADGMLRLLDRDKDIVTGVYYKRGGDHSPVVYKEIDAFTFERGSGLCVTETNIRDFFQVAGCGLGFCLIKVDVFKRIYETFQSSAFIPLEGLGEDLSFCYMAAKLGYEIWADGTIPLNHWGEIAFGRASWQKEST